MKMADNASTIRHRWSFKMSTAGAVLGALGAGLQAAPSIAQAGIVKLWVNGLQKASATCTFNLSNPTKGFLIGALDGNIPQLSQSMQGYLNDFRVTTGTPRYVNNFTPPAVPVPNFY